MAYHVNDLELASRPSFLLWSSIPDDFPLDADYTFVNERLARHYGIPNFYDSRFRRVQPGTGRHHDTEIPNV
ncbi:MAG TPA: hypothetical protein VGR71_17065 [Nitrospira sp.]|nr:hypothetical protein [Nitrospira sp.]